MNKHQKLIYIYIYITCSKLNISHYIIYTIEAPKPCAGEFSWEKSFINGGQAWRWMGRSFTRIVFLELEKPHASWLLRTLDVSCVWACCWKASRPAVWIVYMDSFTNMPRKKVKGEGISYSRICLEVTFFFSHPSHQNFLRTALGCLILYHWGCISNCGWDGLAYLVVKWVKYFGWKQIKVHEHQSPDPTNTSNFYRISVSQENAQKKTLISNSHQTHYINSNQKNNKFTFPKFNVTPQNCWW